MDNDQLMQTLLEIKNDVSALRTDFSVFKTEKSANDVYLTKRVDEIEEKLEKFKHEMREYKEGQMKEYKSLVQKVAWALLAAVIAFIGNIVLKTIVNT